MRSDRILLIGASSLIFPRFEPRKSNKNHLEEYKKTWQEDGKTSARSFGKKTLARRLWQGDFVKKTFTMMFEVEDRIAKIDFDTDENGAQKRIRTAPKTGGV